MTQHQHEDHSGGSQSGTLKRKAADDGNAQQRARRNRYVSIACNECKRRKIKCNGENPCNRCGNLHLECVYTPNCCSGMKDSQEYKEMTGQITSLQEQVQTLFEAMGVLRAQLDQRPQGHDAPSPRLQRQQRQTYAPTDAAYDAATSTSFRQTDPDPQATAAAFMVFEGTNSAPGSSQETQMRSLSETNRMHILDALNSGRVPEQYVKQIEEALREYPNHRQVGPTLKAGRSFPQARNEAPTQLLPTVHPTKDPIWTITQTEALRLCKCFEDEMQLMYPVLDMGRVYPYVRRLYRFIEAAYKSGLMQQGLPGPDALDDPDTNILKMVLALALTVESHGPNAVAQRLYEVVQSSLDKRLLRGEVDIKSIRLLTLTAVYEFHCDNEGTSWRIIGLTCRLCLELGLHRKATYDTIEDEATRIEALTMFWSIYTMDKRWSVGTGMPFAMQESDVDIELPWPGEKSPYLTALVKFSTCTRDVPRVNAASHSSSPHPPLDVELMDDCDQRILHWRQNLPTLLQYDPRLHLPDANPSDQPSRAIQRLRIILYLRANMMRIITFRPVLNSPTTIAHHRRQARTVVHIAKDVIRLLTFIHRATDLFHTQQALFNTFLTPALAILFLAVSHAPTAFADDVREEFHMALQLVRGLTGGSFVSVRLWKTIQGLKELGRRLRIDASVCTPPPAETLAPSLPNPDPTTQDEESHSAAVAMTSLAGTQATVLDDNIAAAATTASTTWPHVSDDSDPGTMADDLSQLFHAVGGDMGNVDLPNNGILAFDDMGKLNGFSGEEGLADVMSQLF